jgi:hypothetical protein
MPPTRDPKRRETVISAAVKARKFSPARAAFWRKEWDRDPTATERVIDRLEPMPASVALAGPAKPSASGDEAEMQTLMSSFGIGKPPTAAEDPAVAELVRGFGVGR